MFAIGTVHTIVLAVFPVVMEVLNLKGLVFDVFSFLGDQSPSSGNFESCFICGKTQSKCRSLFIKVPFTLTRLRERIKCLRRSRADECEQLGGRLSVPSNHVRAFKGQYKCALRRCREGS